MSDDIRWYAIYLGAPRAEFVARDAILDLGMQSFVPVEHKWVARRPNDPRYKLKTRRAYPLCIRYGFVGFPAGAGWHDLLTDHPDMTTTVIRGTRIPVRPVGMTPARPTALPAEQVSYLAALSDRNVPYAASTNPHKGILAVKAGDTARILNPAFLGHFGRVDEILVNKAKVAIQFLGSMRQIEVRVDELEAA